MLGLRLRGLGPGKKSRLAEGRQKRIMKEIPLSNAQTPKVDDEDYE
jgi:hypothetical protein